jgi:alkylation response protein AidB-like acyl-CoA dehydrogenase
MTTTHVSRIEPFFGLMPELLEPQAEARAFALEKLRPSAAELEWPPNPAERVAWDLVEEASERGWRTFGVSRTRAPRPLPPEHRWAPTLRVTGLEVRAWIFGATPFAKVIW